MFDWDDSNINHIARHGLEPEDVEEALADTKRIRADAHNTPFEKRIAIIGANTYGNIIKVVYTERENKIRVVTAYLANNRDKHRYRGGGA
jgi:uncharacterized DUF497 family protein